MGPTAAGKTHVALEAAIRCGATVVSVDSMQVYRGMNIGTAKPSVAERDRVPHLMIDLVEPSVDYTVAQFQRDARAGVASVDGPVLVVGGSGLHFRSLVDPLEFPPTDLAVRRQLDRAPLPALLEELLAADAGAGQALDLANPRRVVRAVEILRLTGSTPSERLKSESAEAVRKYRSAFDLVVFGLDPGPDLEQRITHRTGLMRDLGLLDEVSRLAPSLGRLASLAVGYRDLLDVLTGAIDLEEGFARVRRSTLSLAKRQRTYFGRDPRIRWLPAGERTATAAVETLVDALREGAG
ncbi:MAG: tRNA (adenosine(37)-N6)-dimethylallyltransferase MiaA [Acidimicrobiia bacterium]